MLDQYGNVTEQKIYAFAGTEGGVTTEARKREMIYETGVNYVAGFIRNRLKQLKVDNVTLVTNTYDVYTNGLTNRTGMTLHDTGYGTGTTLRGNVTSTTSLGITNPVNLDYDILGNVVKQSQAGPGGTMTQEVTFDSSKNYSVPSVIKPNSTTTLQTALSWNDFLGLTSTLAPNGATVTTQYSATTARPTESKSPHGAVTTYSYDDANRRVTATTNGRWTQTTMDGFGRTVLAEAGYGGTTVSKVETQYGACACTPMGKVKKVSTPFTGSSASHYTEHVYDALGRTIEIKSPNNQGSTTYLYEGNTVKVTDPDAKWKKYESDSLGRLVKVTEPNPAGGSDLVTEYKYTSLDQLSEVKQVRGSVTQTRTFSYSNGLLASTNNPENGLTSYFYNSDGTPDYRTDAKDQKVQYFYDSFKRVVRIERSPNGTTPDPCQTTWLTYDIPYVLFGGNDYVLGRLAQARTGDAIACPSGPGIAEQFSYNQAGSVIVKRLQISRWNGSSWATGNLDGYYSYSNEGHLTSEFIPNVSDHQIVYVRDEMARLKEAWRHKQINGVWQSVAAFAWGATWGPWGELQALSYLGKSESRTYNALGQLTEINVTGGTAFREAYAYKNGANNGRIESSTDYSVNPSEQVVYQYDALNRLQSASSAGGWGLSFGYDGFGNWNSQSPLPGKTGPSMSLGIDMATNRVTGPGISYDANGNLLTQPGGSTLTYDVENRLKSRIGEGLTFHYGLDNRRVYDGTAWVFWSPDGRVVGRYTEVINWAAGTVGFTGLETKVYFGSRLIGEGPGTAILTGSFTAVVTDRLGSVRERGGTRLNYYPYGQERPSATGQVVPTAKFATYTRETGSGLDYADQRYYQWNWGRFATPDPSEPGRVGTPTSWNFYTYVLGDPINFNDPEGLDVQVRLEELASDRCGVAFANQVLARTGYGRTAQGAYSLFNSKEGTLAVSLFYEVRPNGSYDEDSGFYQSILGVANVYLNRYYSDWGHSFGRGTEGFKQAIFEASTPIWNRRTGSITSRDLFPDIARSLDNILRGPANDVRGECAGLMFAFQFAQNVVARHFGIGYHPVPGMNIYNNVGDALFFHSFRQQIPERHWEWGSRVDYLKTYWTPTRDPRYRQWGAKPFHFFVMRGVHVNRPPGL
jgi:RHS repeat-associated protein